MFACAHDNVVPDILVLGKALGGGILPIAAVVARPELDVGADYAFGHYTHEKNPLGSVAALATLEYIENNQLLQKVNADAEWMQLQLNLLKDQFPLIGDVRGIGLLWGLELVTDQNTKGKANNQAEKIMYHCMANGLSFKVSQGNVLQLSPALTISKAELVHSLQILTSAFKDNQLG